MRCNQGWKLKKVKVLLTRTSLHLLLDPWWNEGRPHDRPLPGGAKTSFTHDITTKYILIPPTSPCWCSPRCSLWLAAHFGTRGSKISWTQLIAKVGYFRGDFGNVFWTVVKVLTIFLPGRLQFFETSFDPTVRHTLWTQVPTAMMMMITQSMALA